MNLRHRERLISVAFVGPAVGVFLLIVLIPLLQGVAYSFTDWDGLHVTAWVGIQNYVNALNDAGFLHAFGLTIRFAAVSVLSINVVGLGLAVLVTRKMRIRNLLRGVFYVPNLIGGLVLGFVWNFIFTQAFPKIGEVLNIPGMQLWLTDFTTGFWGLVILITWQMSGYVMVIYVAAIQGIPSDLLEAAELDGAKAHHILTKIVIPMIAHAFTICLFLTLLNTFKMYDQNLALTGGGPGSVTQMVAMNIYNTAYKYEQMALGQAKSILFLIVVVTITMVQVSLTKKKEVSL